MLLVVIDANVGRQSTDLAPPGSLAAACGDALQAISAQPVLGVVFNTRLLREWGQAGSGHVRIANYAVTWLADMTLQGRVERIEPPPQSELRAALDGLLQNQRVPAEKDLHLIELALTTGRRILSHDSKARGCFALVIPCDARLAALHWVSPVEPDCVAWLQQGAPDEPRYHLTAAPNW